MNPDDEITAVKFSSDGELLTYGTKKGHVWLLDGATLENIRMTPFSYAKGSIKECLFSDCDQYLAALDTDRYLDHI